MNFARLFARLTPVFLLKKRLSFARLFTKMSLSEEVVTLQIHDLVKSKFVNSINSVPNSSDRLIFVKRRALFYSKNTGIRRAKFKFV